MRIQHSLFAWAWMQRLTQRFFTPIDIAPLVFFRVGFGVLMLWEVWRYFHFDRITRYYVEPGFYFHYFGFSWLKPLAGDGMFWLFYGLGLLAVLIMFGAFYRLSMSLFCILFTYVFLLDKAQYLNHFYLVSLVSFLMIFIPAHRMLSVDALLRPARRARVAPTWTLWILRGQMAIVYGFGGLAKINPDWLAGEPMREWMAARTDFPLIGGLFTEEWMVYLFSYGGLLLDLFIVPLLLWPPTRIPALLLATAFHVTNAQLFNIGIFPWFAIAMTLLFLPPHWFSALLPRQHPRDEAAPVHWTKHRGWLMAALAAYFTVQIILPLRHWFYPGDASWTEEGHTLAWRMRLRDKDGTIAFYASEPATGTSWRLPVEELLSRRQYDQMKDNPDMILRFAHYLAAMLDAQHPDVQIHAVAMMSLNSRTPQLLIDPTANLAQEPDNLSASDWILPLVQDPYPGDAVPALLFSRRYRDSLFIINITEQAYPLQDLILQLGDVQLSATAFGVDTLLPGECVWAHTHQASLTQVFVPCNETGQRVTLSVQPEGASLSIHRGAASQLCNAPVCVAALNNPLP